MSEITVKYSEVKAARRAKEPWNSIARRLGVSVFVARGVLEAKADRVVRPRKGGQETSLLVVNTALDRANGQQETVYRTVQQLVDVLRGMHVQRLLIDLEQNRFEITSTESFPLRAAR